MHIQLFISNHAAGGRPLLAALKEAVPGVPISRCRSMEEIGREEQAAYNEKNVAVIMVAGREELTALARRKNTWDKLWTILVLPNSEPEIVTLGHTLRPRFVTFAGSDFSDVAAVLNHIRKNENGYVHS